MRAKVLIGGWSWRGRSYVVDDELDAPAPQVAAWAADGMVEPMEETKPEPKGAERDEPAETAEAEAPPENAAKRTTKPKRKRKGK